MLKWIIGVAIIVSIVSGAFSTYRDNELQAERNADQRALLVQMESINDPVVSQLVDEWRTSYPEPTDEKLMELKIIGQRVKSNPVSAAEFTKATKQKGADKINAAFSSPFGVAAKADGPGI